MRIKNFKKYFESNESNNEYYTSLTENEYDNLFPEDEPTYKRSDYTTNFEENDVNYIKGFLSRRYNVQNTTDLKDVLHIFKINRKGGNNYHGSIIKLKDDWYIVTIGMRNRKHYKCDRLDGLEKCFKEKCV